MNRFIDDKTDETASIWSLITKTEPWLETFLTVHQETSWVYGHFGQVAEGAGELRMHRDDHAMLEAAERRSSWDIFRSQLDEDDDDDADDDDDDDGDADDDDDDDGDADAAAADGDFGDADDDDDDADDDDADDDDGDGDADAAADDDVGDGDADDDDDGDTDADDDDGDADDDDGAAAADDDDGDDDDYDGDDDDEWWWMMMMMIMMVMMMMMCTTQVSDPFWRTILNCEKNGDFEDAWHAGWKMEAWKLHRRQQRQNAGFFVGRCGNRGRLDLDSGR